MSYSEAEYAATAQTYAVPIPAVKTVIEVEAAGEGFLPDGRPKILFEAHYFRDRTDALHDRSHPTISAPYPQSRRYYVGGAGEYDRLAEAAALNPRAALESASWGAGQVMGANWHDLGFGSVHAFVKHVQTKAGQMDVTMRFCKANGLLQHMRDFPSERAFRAFARRYNGPAAVDDYAPKLAAAYARHSGHSNSGGLRIGDRGPDVAELQRALAIAADGIFGPRTDEKVRAFQAANGLTVDGIAGAQTLSALKGD